MSYKNIIDHDFYCTQCGNKGIPICRTTKKNREAGHLKRLYCLICNKETNHVECVSGSKYDVEEFKKEFENGNFREDGTRILSLSEQRKAVAEMEYAFGKKTCLYSGRDVEIEDWMDIFDYVKVGSYQEAFGPLTDERTNQRMYQHLEDKWIDITSKFWEL